MFLIGQQGRVIRGIRVVDADKSRPTEVTIHGGVGQRSSFVTVRSPPGADLNSAVTYYI